MKLIISIGIITLLFFSCANSEPNISHKLPKNLLGVEMHYQYSGGNEYAVKFEKEGISYQYRTGGSPDKWWGKFPYRYMKTENDEHFISWFEEGYGNYVTLLINYDKNILYGSAIIRGEIVHFQKSKISKIKVN